MRRGREMTTIKKTIQCANCGRVLTVGDYQVDGVPSEADLENVHYVCAEALRGRAVQCTCGHYTVSDERKPQ